jgi:hypothetical protein
MLSRCPGPWCLECCRKLHPISSGWQVSSTASTCSWPRHYSVTIMSIHKHQIYQISLLMQTRSNAIWQIWWVSHIIISKISIWRHDDLCVLDKWRGGAIVLISLYPGEELRLCEERAILKMEDANCLIWHQPRSWARVVHEIMCPRSYDLLDDNNHRANYSTA